MPKMSLNLKGHNPNDVKLFLGEVNLIENDICPREIGLVIKPDHAVTLIVDTYPECIDLIDVDGVIKTEIGGRTFALLEEPHEIDFGQARVVDSVRVCQNDEGMIRVIVEIDSHRDQTIDDPESYTTVSRNSDAEGGCLTLVMDPKKVGCVTSPSGDVVYMVDNKTFTVRGHDPDHD